MKNKTLLVTGGTGSFGHAVIHKLINSFYIYYPPPTHNTKNLNHNSTYNKLQILTHIY